MFPATGSSSHTARLWTAPDGRRHGLRIRQVSIQGVRSAINTGCHSGTRNMQPAGRWSHTSRMRPTSGRAASRRPEPGNGGLRRSGYPSPACTAASAWGRTELGARAESAGSKVVPMDVPTLTPGLLHSVEPQWHSRHGALCGCSLSLLEAWLPGRERSR